MLTDPTESAQSTNLETSSSRTEEDVRDQFQAKRQKLRELVKEMDQEAADSTKRQSDRDGE